MLVDISVLSERSADQREVAQWLLRIPEVESVDVITGPLDLRVRLRVRDPDHLREIFFNQLLAAPGVQHTDTSIVMATLEPENFTSNILQSLLRDLGAEE
jgi:DNA-binding Lrp family transcriptional regulator